MRLPAAAATAALTVPLLLAASACSHESDRAADRTTASSTPGGTATGTPSAPGSGGASYPAYGVPDYSYQLEVICYCPHTGQVEVVVHDGEVVSATTLDGPQAGTPAPDFAWLTIDDILEQASSSAIAKAKVRWPDGQDHPSSVMVDRIAQAIDDEVTYTITDVRPEG